ncbi:hypothetical protein G4B88_018349 [Cannabis sativa]|uniref:DUF4283 domain-containing protein n=1 Tax=Cannabis sativa TaxID=3483 RepID=A0A7J6EWC8_CANSA|nr:hypothetical protein G4B88_018349 [Cannabis sativa]
MNNEPNLEEQYATCNIDEDEEEGLLFEVDIERVMEGSPWTYDRVPMIFERLKQDENPRLVVLNKLEFWVQLHNMTTGFMSERKKISDIERAIDKITQVNVDEALIVLENKRRRMGLDNQHGPQEILSMGHLNDLY